MKARTLVVCFTLFLLHAHAQRISPDTIGKGKAALVVQPLVHASLVLTAQGKTIYADPTGGKANYEGLAAPDIIVVTDIHGDHFDTATLAAVSTPSTVLVVPQAVADKIGTSVHAKMVILHNGDNTKAAGIAIKAIPMYNIPESPKAMHTKGRGNGYVITAAGKNIYLSGDTQGIPEMRSLTNIDVAFVCMNLPYTMDIKEAAESVLAFAPKIVYPYHYRGQGGLSDVNGFKTLVDAGHKPIEVRLRNWYAIK